MPKFQRGQFVPQQPDKYIGKRAPQYRSGWELAVMRMCDNHPAILGWGSETHRIPYKNPLTGKQTTYVPDLLIVYKDKNGKNHAEMVEIKPASQTIAEARTQAQKAAAVVNQAKWAACHAWCKSQGMGFRVITEHQIFNKPQNSKKKRKK
jgi:hypothetical protein